MSEESKSNIERTRSISDPELIQTATITVEVIIGGAKTWVGLSTQFLVRDINPKDALDAVFDDVQEFCRDKNASSVTSHLTQAQAEKPREAQAGEIPNFDDDIGWKTFKTKEPCRDDEAGWAFIDNRNNPDGASKLREMLERGAMRVRMRGTVFDVKMTEKFFNRNPPQAKVRRYQ